MIHGHPLAGPRPVRAVLRAFQSLTLYLQLYLGGFGLELSDIEALRTWVPDPGHPEFRHTKGVEITTGTAGWGLASAVGMAMAARATSAGCSIPTPLRRGQPVRPLHLRHRLRRRHGGGRHQRGVPRWRAPSSWATLIVIWDDNEISIEHNTNIAFTEDLKRYRGLRLARPGVEGGENVVGIEEAIAKAKAVTDKPSFIALRTIIGYRRRRR